MPSFVIEHTEDGASHRSTSWPTVLMAIAAGVLAAFQVGKVHIALPSIRLSFSLGLVGASWILSALNTVGLFTATPVGTFCSRIGNKSAVVAGLFFVAAASALGGFSPSLKWLLATRFLEGIGFMMIVVAAPSLIVEVADPKKLRLALAGWSAYMPGGIALINLLAAPVLEHHTWRTVWWLNALLLFGLSVVIGFFGKKRLTSGTKTQRLGPWNELSRVVAARGPVFLAVIFAMYTMQHLSVMGFMPTLLHDRFQISQARIGMLVSVAMASNIVGNLAAGFLLQRGIHRSRLIILTSIFMACMTVVMFTPKLPFVAFYCCTFAFSCVGGMIPSSLISAVPFYSPSPSLLGATNGLLVQGSCLGIVAGPPMMSLIATHLGWSWVPVMTGISAIVAVVLAYKMRVPTNSAQDLARP